MREQVDIRDQESALSLLAEAILGEAQRLGADAAEVSASVEIGLNVRVRKGAIEAVEYGQDRGFGITIHDGQRKGSASTSDSSDAAVRETVARAADIARRTQADPCNGLAGAELMAQNPPDLDLFHPAPLDAAATEASVLACEAAGLNADKRIVNSEGGEASISQSCVVYANSHGFLGHYAGTRQSMSCVLIAEDGNGMQRDYWYSAGRKPESLEAPEEIGRKAAARTLARLSPQKVATGHFPVIFAAESARSVAGHIIGALSGGALYRKASFLLDSLGDEVAHPSVSLFEQPMLPAGLGSAAFDADGVATREQAFIAEGRVRGYALSAYSGRRLGLPTTGNAGGVHNLRLTGRTLPFADLLREMGAGLYVTELMGMGVNGVTGDYSQGASGFWVEGGEIRYPVHEVTIAGNLKDMMRNLRAVGDDEDWRGNIITPSLLIDGMTLAGGG